MELLLWLQNLRNPVLDALMMGVTHLGDQIVVIVIMCLVLWCVDRRAGIKLALIFFLGGMVSQLLKLVFVIERPWVLDARIVPLEAALAGATGWSFPSGHTASAVALYGGLFMLTKSAWKRALCVLAAALVALSRLYAGVHTPADVAVSIVVGAILVVVAWRALDAERQRQVIDRWILGVSGGITVAMLAVVIFRYAAGYPVEMLEDAVAAAGAAAGFLAGWWLLRNRSMSVKAALPWQIAKLAVGLGVCVAIKMMDDFGVVAVFFAYALLALWAAALYPMLFHHVFHAKNRGEAT
jgi:undecaprenyl-diphosphatase